MLNIGDDNDGPIGPSGMARECEAAIAKLIADRTNSSPAERREINEQLRRFRRLLAFCKTRAGYAEPDRSRPY